MRALIASALTVALIAGLLYLIIVPRTRIVYGSTSPDGLRSIHVEASKFILDPDWAISLRVEDESGSRKVYTSGDAFYPNYIEAFWLEESRVLVLECRSSLVLEYDFKVSRLTEDAWAGLDVVLAGWYAEAPRTNDAERASRIEDYCEKKIGLSGTGDQ